MDDLISKIQNGIKATDADDAYSCGMRNGMRWCISIIDGKEPLYENCPSAKPDCSDCIKHGGDWDCDHVHCHKGESAQPLTAYVISDEDGNIKCSNCGSFECWGNYCMNCGAKMRGKNNG